MRILLLNDNPVVRKLVALSAQKTKDDLNVVSSIDEIEHSEYDLFIVDDALYSDDGMAALEEKIRFKTSLLMATRGNTVSTGFDHVINKPFLPTDLVELFATIENNLSKVVMPPLKESLDDLPNEDLDSMLEGLEGLEDVETLALDDAFDLDELDDALSPNVLDHEEVQELQDLLDDTESQSSMPESFGMEEDEIKTTNLTEEEDDDLLGDLGDFDMEEDALVGGIEDFDLEEGDLGELDELDELGDFNSDEKSLSSLGEILDNAESFEEIVPEEDEEFGDLDSLKDEETPLSDDDFDDLELQIKKATGELGFDDLELESELEETSLDELDELDSDALDTVEMDVVDDLGGFEGINERDMKRALGEEVEDVTDETVTKEELAYEVAKIEPIVGNTKPSPSIESSSPVQGVEALQALLKALSNDDVVKSLKGLNISININFGETK